MPGNREEAPSSSLLLTINTGSSSLKAGIYRCDRTLRLELAATVERVGYADSRLRIADRAGTTLLDREEPLSNHGDALQAVLDYLASSDIDSPLCGIGHRVVHGGRKYSAPTRIDGDLVADVRALVPIDPTHLPQALEAIETASARYPSVPQIACFDTAFHRSMPRVAQMYALPAWVEEKGVLRYGFHGLSCESIMDQLASHNAAEGRVVIAHLGNGASMTAVRDGRGVDTTMGFTPTGGLVMATRSGDLDPGVLLFLLQSAQLNPAELNELVNLQAGMRGVSGGSADMRDLLERAPGERRAAEAVELFCYMARKSLGGLTTALGGLDTLVFTAGIGENAAPIRERICAGLDYLGIEIDTDRNRDSASVISRQTSAVTVRVMKTDEDMMIARHTVRILR
ncbi:MAG TPA: acetate/propionate family kinase [Chloroflexota bacterium]